jgi:hypothetical protein
VVWWAVAVEDLDAQADEAIHGQLGVVRSAGYHRTMDRWAWRGWAVLGLGWLDRVPFER